MARRWPRALQALQALPMLAVLCVSALCASASALPAEPSMASPPPSHAPGAPVAAVPQEGAPATNAGPQDIASFFPAIKGDLTKVTWAHAVNSRALLVKALNESSAMMLEADVVLGTTPDSPSEVPVMGHPPDTTSDLSLQEFLRTVVAYNADHNATRRGVKLDFKSIGVFEKSIDYLKQTFQVPTCPVWLNADILPGPVNASATPVEAATFLAKAKAEYPDLMLSLGWTTRWGKGLDGEKVPQDRAMYSKKNVEDMVKAVMQAQVVQPITYAVRAAFVANSLAELKVLLDDTPQKSGNATLTVWSSDETDVVDVKKLRSNILDIGKHRVYLDVGEKLAKQLNLGNSAAGAYASVATTLMALLAVMLKAL